jgi:hypothetical protein
MHQHRKLLPPKPVNTVIGSEGVVHDARHQQQHFFGDLMPILVIDG